MHKDNYKPIELINACDLFQRPLYAKGLKDYVQALQGALDIAQEIVSGQRSEEYIDSFAWRAVDALYRMRKRFASLHPKWDIQGWNTPTGLGVQLIHMDELKEMVNERVEKELLRRATKARRAEEQRQKAEEQAKGEDGLEDFDF